MKFVGLIICMATLGLSAQPRSVTEAVPLTGQDYLELEFAFADLITFKTWDKNEVRVEVEVEINDGKYNDIFSLESSKSSSTVRFEMDADMWEKIDEDVKWNNCNWKTDIDYVVYLPADIKVTANTITGDYEFEFYGTVMDLKTISGAIDVTVPSKEGLDFKAKTISGEVYSDIDISFPYGKEGLRQIVGQKVRGRINSGGPESKFETISGDIFLRKG